jgi:hypothetical protein
MENFTLLKTPNPIYVPFSFLDEIEVETLFFEEFLTEEELECLREKWFGRPSLAELYYAEIDHSQTLLGDRWLCRKGVAVIAAPAGIGKSTLALQQHALWALGREGFGIRPAKALRILVVQAENDQGDLTEFARGTLGGLKFTPEEIQQIGENTCYITARGKSGDAFISFLRKEIKRFKPDLVHLDPLMAYLGADPVDTAAVSKFLRVDLNQALEKFNCGALINHHTPKTNYRNTATWQPHDWMYALAGCADITNFARAVLVVDPCKDRRTFRFIAAKRAQRIGWSQPERYFAHATDGIYWVEAEAPVLTSSTGRPSADKDAEAMETILGLVPTDKENGIEKNLLVKEAAANGIGLNRARKLIEDLITSKRLTPVNVHRAGARPQVCVKYAPAPIEAAIANTDKEEVFTYDEDDFPF